MQKKYATNRFMLFIALLALLSTYVPPIVNVLAEDLGQLQVEDANPANSASDVSITQSVYLSFNANVQPGISFSLITLASDYQTVAVTASVYANQLTITPLQPLNYSTSYSLTLPADSVQNLDGYYMESTYTLQFTTEDSLAPPLIDTFEPNDTPNLAYDAAIGVEYTSYLSNGLDIDFYRIQTDRDAVLNINLTVPEESYYQLAVFSSSEDIIASGTSQPITFLAAAEENYWIRVSGIDINDYGSEPYTWIARYVLDAPQNLRALSHSGASAEIAWDSLNEHWGSVTYHVYQDDQFLISTSGTTLQLSNLIGGATVQYTVKASNGTDLDSPASNAISLTLFGDDVTPPTMPTIALSESDWTNQDVEVTIISGEDSYSGVLKDEYRIGSDGEWTVYSEPIIIHTEGMTTIYARTFDNAGNISQEAENIVRIDRTAPAAPSRLIKTNVGLTTIEITWAETSDDVGVVNYRIYNEDLLLGETSGRQATLTHLTPASMYHLSIRAVDAAGNESLPSHELMVTTYQQPVYHYDPLDTGRLDRIQYEDGTIIKFDYDANGNLTQTYILP